jgi:hypothetical protein
MLGEGQRARRKSTAQQMKLKVNNINKKYTAM